MKFAFELKNFFYKRVSSLLVAFTQVCYSLILAIDSARMVEDYAGAANQQVTASMFAAKYRSKREV